MVLAGATSLMAADGAAVFNTKCSSCHGKNAELKAMNKSAVIQGEDAAVTVEKLKGYKDGSLNQYGLGNVMKGIAGGLSDEDMQAVADYIATLK